MTTPLERRLAELDAIPLREQFRTAYRAERAKLHQRQEAAELDRHAFGLTTFRATMAAVDAICARERDARQTTPAERLAARREHDSLFALFSGDKRNDHDSTS